MKASLLSWHIFGYCQNNQQALPYQRDFAAKDNFEYSLFEQVKSSRLLLSINQIKILILFTMIKYAEVWKDKNIFGNNFDSLIE